jgi:hypothetical protein
MALAAPPVAPNRSQPTTFSSRMDDFLAYFYNFFLGVAGIGYPTGTGGAVTQLTSRTTAVTLDKPCGRITMFSAAGSTTLAQFTVNNSIVEAEDVIILNQATGTNPYRFQVRNVVDGSFDIAFQTVSGTATDAPIINFAIIKSVNA